MTPSDECHHWVSVTRSTYGSRVLNWGPLAHGFCFCPLRHEESFGATVRASARLGATWRDFEALLPACPPCTAVYSKEKVAAPIVRHQ